MFGSVLLGVSLPSPPSSHSLLSHFTFHIKGPAGHPTPLLVHPVALLSLLPGRNTAAPTPNPSAPTTSQVGELAQGPNHKPRSGLPGSALVAIVAVSLTVVILSATLLFMYVRRQRMRQKRAEHRKRLRSSRRCTVLARGPYNTGG
ncbi:hypothetical protein EI94DRAFT_1815115 [Lactarius quietus]|nr:hypothetical protein EI94DRAFT_1815115 [Lactarius quietus]